MESYRESHKRKGADYYDTFATIPHRAILWKLERTVLDRIVRERFLGVKPRYLDFACGTGRILGHLEPRVESAVGVDVSSSMLQIARANVPAASIIEADITRSDVLGPLRFDLITAFRFFPNAEPTLRSEVMAKLAEHLTPGGYLVFNNHKNQNSLVRRILRWRNRLLSEAELMSMEEVQGLVCGAGLHIVMAYPLGILPVTERRTPRPYWLIAGLEDLASRIPGVLPLAQNIIYLCRKPLHPDSMRRDPTSETK